ncbi:MAG: hypothetical protein F4164_12185 [Gemmatimonadales bacterium]|nr:hypothetical protein [Gemmatimonadales bacterium]MYG50090.1 hypothetical protein [Gemmatimonadales bacterium]MYK03260.1 hypothetical protein [Candidatus Palauibacter ramosifaciens]
MGSPRFLAGRKRICDTTSHRDEGVRVVARGFDLQVVLAEAEAGLAAEEALDDDLVAGAIPAASLSGV